MLKKIKDWVGSNLDVYKVENASDVGAGLVRHIWKGEETASQIGTTLTAQIMNDLQKGLVHTLNTTRTAGTNKDIYEVILSGIEEFGVFDGLKLLIRIDGENQYDDVFLKLGGVEYPIYRVKENSARKLDKGALKEKKEYLLNYSNNSFVLSDSTLYGTTAGTALEGNRLAEIIGIEFGGNIQDTGNKVKGKFYFDSVTKFYYECIENTNLTYNDATKFRAISNKPISDRLENLSEIWNLIFFGKLEEWTEQGVYIPFSKKFTKIKIAYTAQRNVNNAAYGYEEYTLSKNNFKLVSTEHTLAYVKEDSQFLYFQIVSNTNVNDNYAYIYAK